MVTFQKATKKRAKLRLAIDGPSGSGKTYTALVAATAIADGGKIAVIDTERGSASLYSDKFTFDVLELEKFSPLLYVEAIQAAEEAGYAVIVVDSLSHAWEGEGGALDLVDQAAARANGNSFMAWKNVTPIHRKLVDAILQSKCHIIATMRSKMDYSQEKDEKGRTVIRKIGLAPVQRQSIEYEFTIVGDMDMDHNLIVSKSRADFLSDAVEKKPTVKFFKKILDWLNSGEAAQEPAPKAAVKQPEPETPPLQPAAAQPVPPPPPAQPAPKPAPMTDPKVLDDLDKYWPKDAKVSYEQAILMKSSDGTYYTDMSPEELSNRTIGIGKLLKKNGLNPEQKEDYQYRNAVISAILQAKNAMVKVKA